jgi:spore germination protein PE
MIGKRVSVVRSIHITATELSSIVQIGDSRFVRPRSQVFALQRQVPVFWENEGDFARLDAFSKPIPRMDAEPENALTVEHRNPVIRVDHVEITGLSVSAVFQVGANERIDAEARVMHVRNFIEGI